MEEKYYVYIHKDKETRTVVYCGYYDVGKYSRKGNKNAL